MKSNVNDMVLNVNPLQVKLMRDLYFELIGLKEEKEGTYAIWSFHSSGHLATHFEVTSLRADMPYPMKEVMNHIVDTIAGITEQNVREQIKRALFGANVQTDIS